MTRLELAARLAIGRELSQTEDALCSRDVVYSITLGSALFGAWHSGYQWVNDRLSFGAIQNEAERLYGGHNA